MKLGYARVSTGEQNLTMQIDALRAAGCEQIYKDRGVSGAAVIKPAYLELLSFARKGDEVVVWKMDRLSRSLTTLIAELKALEGRGLEFLSLTEKIETATPGGKFYFHMIGAFGEFERDIIRERTRAGLDAARRAGKKLGRPPLITPEQWQHAKSLMTEPHNMNPAQVSRILNVTPQAIYKRLNAERQAEQNGE